MRKLLMGVVVSLAIVSEGFACTLAGENKHIGRLLAVDAAAGEFVLLDAETQRELRFAASPQLLDLLRPGRTVKVRYEEDEKGRLVTVALTAI